MTTTTSSGTGDEPRQVGGSIDAAIDACTGCHQICNATVQYCLYKGGKHVDAQHIRVLIDCAEICQTTANVMQRGSPLHMRTCSACADVCEECAASCEMYPGDARMKQAADACRVCAQACRQMSRM